MEDKLIFKINMQEVQKELYLDVVLIDYNGLPVFFTCRDQNGGMYIVQDLDGEGEHYAVVKVGEASVLQLLEQKLTMRQLMQSATKYYDIIVDDEGNDIVAEKNMLDFPADYLPVEDSLFMLACPEHEEYKNRLEDNVNNNKTVDVGLFASLGFTGVVEEILQPKIAKPLQFNDASVDNIDIKSAA